MGTAGPGDAGQADKRSAEDAGEYARRLRSLPVGQVLGDFLFSLINAAQVKLGRRDARLLIDVTAVAHEHARPYLPAELTRQIDRGPSLFWASRHGPAPAGYPAARIRRGAIPVIGAAWGDGRG